MDIKNIAKRTRRWLFYATTRLRLLPCYCGIHSYKDRPIVANLDTYWLQGGEECSRCRTRKISFAETTKLTELAYERGKQHSEVSFLAYGNGVEKTVTLYGKPYVQQLIDKIPSD